MGWPVSLGRTLVIGALAAAILLPEANAERQSSEIVIICINKVSGASWQIRIDYDRRTVDSNPARISDTEISWRDAADGWYYRLDRKSGNLEVVLASATGGNFLHHRCKLEN